MLKSFSMRCIGVAFLMMSAVGVCVAEPTLNQVYQAANAGNMSEAQSMMDQVLKAHPTSAKAHYVEAELLVRQGNLASAKNELATAERLAPGLPFAKPEAVSELKAKANGGQFNQTANTSNNVSSGSNGGGMSVMWLLIAAVAFIVIVTMIMRRRNTPQVIGGYNNGYGSMNNGAPMNGGPIGGAPMGGGYGYGPMGQPSGGMGSSILGGLATGAAVGAGIVAGETLMHKMMDDSPTGHAAPVDTSFNQDPNMNVNYDMGGNNFGVNDTSSWDDNSGSSWGDDSGGDWT